jgi:hypothetical protein
MMLDTDIREIDEHQDEQEQDAERLFKVSRAHRRARALLRQMRNAGHKNEASRKARRLGRRR